MRLQIWVGIAALLISLPAFAQRGQPAPRGVYGGQGPRGMYGGVSTGQMVGVINDPGFAGRLGATVSGLPQTTTRIPVQRGSYGGGFGGYIGGGRGGSSGGGRGGSGRTNTVIVPWGVPVMYGGGVGYGYDYSMAPAPTQTIVQPLQPAPSVVINQYYTPETGSRAEMREYSDLPQPIRPPRTEVEESDGRVTVVPAPRQPAAAAPAPSDPTGRTSLQAATTPTITLLRLKDTGSIAEVIAYWRQGESLHYITSDYQKVVLPLEALDRDGTAQLNRERNVEFRIEEIR